MASGNSYMSNDGNFKGIKKTVDICLSEACFISVFEVDIGLLTTMCVNKCPILIVVCRNAD